MDFREIKDGRNDVVILMDGKPFILMPQEGYESVGVTLEQALAIMEVFSQILVLSGLAKKVTPISGA